MMRPIKTDSFSIAKYLFITGIILFFFGMELGSIDLAALGGVLVWLSVPFLITGFITSKKLSKDDGQNIAAEQNNSEPQKRRNPYWMVVALYLLLVLLAYYVYYTTR